MATKNYTELQGFSLEELQNELSETKSQYQKLKFDHHIRGLENPLRLREARKVIARISTEIRRREISEMSPEQIAKRDRIRNRRK